MMVCPQCGYGEKRDWSKLLLLLSFVLLIAAWVASDFVPKHEVKWVAFAGFLAGIAGGLASAFSGLRHGRQHADGATQVLSNR